MIGNEEQDAFINRNKWAVVTTLRKDGSPTSSVIFFVREGDTLLFSTTESRLKTRTVRRDPRVSLTVLDEGAPFGFVNVEGNATIETDELVANHVKLNRAMRSDPAWEPPAGYEDRLRAEGRLMIRVTPDRVSGVTNRG